MSQPRSDSVGVSYDDMQLAEYICTLGGYSLYLIFIVVYNRLSGIGTGWKLPVSIPLNLLQTFYMNDLFYCPALLKDIRESKRIFLLIQKYVVAATRSPPPLRLETISGRDGQGPAHENLRLSLQSQRKPGQGKKAESIVQGTWEFAGAWRGSFEPSTAAHSKECKRSPEQFIPTGFPSHNNLQTGTEDSANHLPTPDLARSGRVLPSSTKSLF